MELIIAPCTLQQCLPLRQLVLYPGQDPHLASVPEDEHAVHLGAWHERQLIGVVSLFTTGKTLQFRKFAILPSWQRRGVGSKMMHHLEQHARERACKQIWCNARTNAKEFYRRHGYHIWSETYTAQGHECVRMLKELD